MPVKKAFGSKFVMFGGADGTTDLGIYKREALARDAAVAPEGNGFPGFSITHIADSAQHVDELLARAAGAGGEIVRQPVDPGRGDYYSGSFADPDGNLWHVTSCN